MGCVMEHDEILMLSPTEDDEQLITQLCLAWCSTNFWMRITMEAFKWAPGEVQILAQQFAFLHVPSPNLSLRPAAVLLVKKVKSKQTFLITLCCTQDLIGVDGDRGASCDRVIDVCIGIKRDQPNRRILDAPS